MTLRRIETLTDGGRGMTAQAEGVARHLLHLAGLADLENSEKTGAMIKTIVRPPMFFSLLPPTLAAKLSSSPDSNSESAEIAIGCGARAQAALIRRRQSGAFAICIQRPRGGEKHFDAVVAPRHDYSADEIADIENGRRRGVFLTLGAVGEVTHSTLSARRDSARRRFESFGNKFGNKFIGALIGGDNRAYRLSPSLLAEQLQAAADKSGAALLITPSARTDAAVRRTLRESFGGRHYVWDGAGNNPYLDILAAADGLCATADSVNMISEACAAGKSVCLLPMLQKGGWRAARAAKKFARFHSEIVGGGWAKFWPVPPFWRDNENNPPAPLSETARTARQLWDAFQARR